MPVAYVPILKGKEGEYGALQELVPEIKDATMPLIEIPPVPRDWERDRPARSLEEHVGGVADRIETAWGDRPLFIDFPWFVQENLENGESAMSAVLANCRAARLNAVPVIRRESSRGHIGAAAEHHAQNGLGVALRLRPSDFDDDLDIDGELDAVAGRLGATPATTDLIVDLENIATDAMSALLVVKAIKAALPRLSEWRRIILAASSFPQDLSEINAASTSELPRIEWELWSRVQNRPERALRADVIFGDYAIAHPEPREMDPRMMRMSASIRYTTPLNWLVLKGRNVRQWGYEQFFELCAALIARPEYCGAEYSWGDRQISLCANRETGTGNATTWRKVATNHHITLVARQIANPPAP